MAGRGRAARLVEPVVARLADSGVAARVLIGGDREDSARLCRQAVEDGASALAVLGGDGMVHLGLQAVAGGRTPLGIVPTGTGNDFATCLGIPADIDAAVDVLLAGAVRVVDAVRSADDRGETQWWACVLGAGFDSAVNERANRMRRPRGPRRYDVAIFAELLRLRARPFVLEVDGRREELLANFIAVGNAASYGGGMRIAPAADLSDGQLDVTIVGPVSRLDMVRFKPMVYSGTHVQHPSVSTRRGRVIRLDGAGQVAYADGERLAALPVNCECVPGALRVLAPSAEP